MTEISTSRAAQHAAAQADGVVDLDLGRAERRGYPEAIYCEGKSLEDLRTIARLITDHPDTHHLFTRADEEKAAAILEILPDAHHDPVARFLAWFGRPGAIFVQRCPHVIVRPLHHFMGGRVGAGSVFSHIRLEVLSVRAF